jgi:hypothetical protein
MEITQSQLLRASVIDFWGRFASGDMEERFRREQLAEDLKTAKFLAWIYALSTAVFFFTDWVLKGVTPTFLLLILPRSVIVLSCAMVILRLRFAIASSWSDRWLLAWISLNLVMELHVHSTNSSAGAALSSLLFIWALSSLVPMRFSYQAGSATVAALAFTALIIAKKPEPGLLAKVLIASLTAFVIGLVCSRRMHRSRRESFAAHLVERETGVLLEAALAQVETLEGILPICAACKKIREKDNAWMPLDEYVSNHTGALFSHGMCPDCMARFYSKRSSKDGKSQDS